MTSAGDGPAGSALARHQRRDASAASAAPAEFSSTSSTEDTRSRRRMYCALSIRVEQAAPSASIRGTDAKEGNRKGAKNPSAASTRRLPMICPASIVARSRSGTRLTRPATTPAPDPGNMVIHSHGTVP